MAATAAAPNIENPCTGGPPWPPRSAAPRLFSEESFMTPLSRPETMRITS